MHWLRTSVKVAGVAIGLLLIGLACSIGYLRLDKEAVFYEVRGTYQAADTLDEWKTAESSVSLLQLRNLDGHAVTDVYFRRPVELDPDYRILVIYAGAKTRENILTLVPERSDVVLVGVQYPYDSPDGLLEHLRWPQHIRAAGFRTVAGGMLALDFLHEDAQLDVDRVAVIGISVGVPFATLHGALDERVPIVMLIHGGGDLVGQVRAIQESRGLAIASGILAGLLFHSFEPLHYVDRIAPRKLVIIGARNETMLPLASVEKLYAKAGEPKQLIWTESDHVRSRSADVIAQIIQQIDRYLESEEENGSDPDS